LILFSVVNLGQIYFQDLNEVVPYMYLVNTPIGFNSNLMTYCDNNMRSYVIDSIYLFNYLISQQVPMVYFLKISVCIINFQLCYKLQ